MPHVADGEPVRLLFSCVGRRVELVQAFRAAARRLGRGLAIFGTDSSPIAPALACVDHPYLAPPITHAGYSDQLIDLVRQHRIHAIVPTIDTDLPVLSERQADFAALGCIALVAGTDVVRICRDKIETHAFLRRAGFDTPATYLPTEILAIPPAQRRFPYFVKPRFGSASLHAHKAADELDLSYFLTKGRDPIVQEFVDGVEHTLDVYVGLTGVPRCVVPRARWAVRGGEVTQGVVNRDPAIMDAGRRVVEALGDSPRGLVTLQCIVTPAGAIRFIEINARFGGGAPLGIAAGADYPLWLLMELCGQTPAIAADGFEHGVCMSRYDWSVFLSLGDAATPRLAPPSRPFPPF